MESRLKRSIVKNEQNREEQCQSPRFFYVNPFLDQKLLHTFTIKKRLRDVVFFFAVIIISLSSNIYAENGDAFFTTYEDHIEEIKQKIKKEDEKPEKYFQDTEARKDYDGDGIKDISIKSDKNIYFVSSIDIKEGESNNDKWVWYKVEE